MTDGRLVSLSGLLTVLLMVVAGWIMDRIAQEGSTLSPVVGLVAVAVAGIALGIFVGALRSLFTLPRTPHGLSANGRLHPGRPPHPPR